MKYLAKIVRQPPYKSYWIGEPNNFMGFETAHQKARAMRFRSAADALYAINCVKYGDETFIIEEVTE